MHFLLSVWSFSSSFLLLISSLVPLWSRNIVYISFLLEFVKACLWFRIWSILWMFHVHLKRMYILILEMNQIKLLMVSFSSLFWVSTFSIWGVFKSSTTSRLVPLWSDNSLYLILFIIRKGLFMRNVEIFTCNYAFVCFSFQFCLCFI